MDEMKYRTRENIDSALNKLEVSFLKFTKYGSKYDITIRFFIKGVTTYRNNHYTFKDHPESEKSFNTKIHVYKELLIEESDWEYFDNKMADAIYEKTMSLTDLIENFSKITNVLKHEGEIKYFEIPFEDKRTFDFIESTDYFYQIKDNGKGNKLDLEYFVSLIRKVNNTLYTFTNYLGKEEIKEIENKILKHPSFRLLFLLNNMK